MFEFTSSQTHSVEENGHQKTRTNTVSIANGKGIKTVEIRENGKTRKSTKKLNSAEIAKIQTNQFIPGLFKPCLDCLNSRTALTQTRRTPKKKSGSRR